MEDRMPTGKICTSDGWHSIPLATRNIYFAGGQFFGCLNRAARAALLQRRMPVFVPPQDISLREEERTAIKNAASHPAGLSPIVLHYLMDAIYFAGNPEMSGLIGRWGRNAFSHEDESIAAGQGLAFTSKHPSVWRSVRARVILREDDGSAWVLQEGPDSPAPVVVIHATTTERLLDGAGPEPHANLTGLKKRVEASLIQGTNALKSSN